MKNFLEISYKEVEINIKKDKKLIKTCSEIEFYITKISSSSSQLNLRIKNSLKEVISTYIQNQLSIKTLKNNKKISKIYKKENKILFKNLKIVSNKLEKMSKKKVDLSQFEFLNKNLKLLDKVIKGEEI